MIAVTFLSKQKLTNDTYMFIFKHSSFQYRPGQYLTLFIKNDWRDFTVCPSPLGENTFAIITKKSKSIFKQQLFQLPKNVIVQIKGPAGGFIFHQNNRQPKFFLAGGIGITPFYSILQSISNQNLQSPITLFATFATRRDIFFKNELEQIAKNNTTIKIIFSLTKEQWDGERGRISEQLIKKYIQNVLNGEYMIAGGTNMVEDTEKILLGMGILQQQLKMDIFTGYEN